jgi:hypothetical protein
VKKKDKTKMEQQDQQKIPVCKKYYEITPKSPIVKDSIACIYTTLFNMAGWNYSVSRTKEQNVDNQIIPMQGELYCVMFSNVMCQLDMMILQSIDSQAKPLQILVKLLSKQLQFHVGGSRVLNLSAKRKTVKELEKQRQDLAKQLTSQSTESMVDYGSSIIWRENATKDQEHRQLILINLIQHQFAIHFYEDIHLLQFTVDSTSDDSFVLCVHGFERCDIINVKEFGSVFYKNMRSDDYKVVKVLFDLKHSCIMFHVDNVKRKTRNLIVHLNSNGTPSSLVGDDNDDSHILEGNNTNKKMKF